MSWQYKLIKEQTFIIVHTWGSGLFITFLNDLTNEFLQNFFQKSHDPSEIILICWFGAQETFVIIISVENRWAA